jgi:tryptophan synthase alpha subunit
VSDGVVVGSVLVNKIAETLTSYKSDGPSEKAAVNELFSIVASMRQAIDQT